MNLRELKNQLLSEIKRREEISSNVQEIETSTSDQRIESEEEVKQEFEPSEFYGTQLGKDESESLQSIQEIELAEDVKERIEPSEIDETKLEKDKPEILEFDSKIKFAKDVKQILRNIVHHLETESSSRQSDLRSTGSPLKDTSNLFKKLDVKVISEESTIKEYKKDDIPIKLKSKFGVLKKWSVKDK